jgi:hypothetical protein
VGQDLARNVDRVRKTARRPNESRMLSDTLHLR